jgi:outer membrane receptor protein involved in Fe transport
MHYTNFPISKQDAFTTSDFTLTYTKDKWQVRAFVRNIENDVVYSYVNPNASTTDGTYYLQDPRTFGVGVNVKFE